VAAQAPGEGWLRADDLFDTTTGWPSDQLASREFAAEFDRVFFVQGLDNKVFEIQLRQISSGVARANPTGAAILVFRDSLALQANAVLSGG
jgi:hypothetical protein